jgi:hypothetical protein
VRDEKGRRRFHGAFTGGFSAGYYNSVGSKEGKSERRFEGGRHRLIHNRMGSLVIQVIEEQPSDKSPAGRGLYG